MRHDRRWAPAGLAVAALTIAAACGALASGTPTRTTGEASGGSPTSAALASPCSAAPPADAARVVIASFTFCPGTTTVAAGTEVGWQNDDRAPHTVTFESSASGALFDSGSLDPGAVATTRFDRPGTYAYYCRFHPAMRATIVVAG
jgi:plastocyanin